MTAIAATGIKGFLLWLKSDQPGIYSKVAPILPKIAPEAFTNINRKTLGRLRAIYKSGVARRSSQALGQYDTCFLPEITVEAPSYQNFATYDSGPVTVNYANLSAPICAGPISAPDQLTCPTVNTGTDIASAANSGNSSVQTTQAIAGVINTVAQTALSAAALAQYQNMVASQLLNAQAGAAPKNVSSATLGIPTVKTSATSNSSLIWFILAGLGAWAVLS